METSTPAIWDPIRGDLPVDQYQLELRELLQPYQGKTNKFFWSMVGCIIIDLCVLVAFIYRPFVVDLFIIGMSPPFLYWFYVSRLQDRTILAFLCYQNSWLYAPKVDTNRAEAFASLIPDIFGRGYDRKFEEQIWGNIGYQGKVASFWTAKFSYTTGSGKSKHTTTQPIFIFRLPRVIPIVLRLTKEGFFKGGKDEIKTESLEFNNTFRIATPVTNQETTMQVIKLLTPSVQTRLLDFAKKYKIQEIIFEDDMLIFIFPLKIWKVKHTNFFKSPNIDPRDITIFNEILISMAELPTEMLQFID